MVAFLTRELKFPAPEKAGSDGLLAVGGDLSAERLLLAYRSGIFPWPIHPRVLTWFSPDPRAILELDELHISRSLAKRARRPDYEIRFDTAFEEVMKACAERTERRASTWIIPEMLAAYGRLQTLGHAHSVEVWMEGRLVGGLYGVSIGGLFAGESMFSRATDTSKLALIHLVERMKDRKMTLLDVQVPNPHLETLGIRTIPRAAYLRRLEEALRAPVRFSP
ncbi:MAG: leucyl/phenylalanyl-tRNA--protein transferase [Myxococcota bacterium]